MNRTNPLVLLLALLPFYACSSPEEPLITPPQPQFADAVVASDPVDHRIFGDVDPGHDAIDIEWKQDTTNSTTGYLLYRSLDSTIGADGLLTTRDTVAQIESSNLLADPLPTSARDTTNIIPGKRYFYQLIAFYRSPTGTVQFSKPTAVNLTTSFKYEQRVIPERPLGTVTRTRLPLQFEWSDPLKGGLELVILRKQDGTPVWSGQFNDFGSDILESYPDDAPALVAGEQYEWRVKRIDLYGGSSSSWTPFTLQ